MPIFITLPRDPLERNSAPDFSTQSAQAASMSGSDSEPDYDDPRFLDPASTSSASASFGAQDLDLTYAERRKRTLAAQAERGRNKSRKQVEEETRDAGLSTNLIAREQRRDEAGEGASTAFKMMRCADAQERHARSSKLTSGPTARWATSRARRSAGNTTPRLQL